MKTLFVALAIIGTGLVFRLDTPEDHHDQAELKQSQRQEIVARWQDNETVGLIAAQRGGRK